MKRIAVLLLALLLLASQPAHADTSAFTAADIYKMCVSKYDTDYGFCTGYVSAVANTLLTESIGGYRACNHGTVRSQQFVDIFKKYAESSGAPLSDAANHSIAASIARAFPCRQ